MNITISLDKSILNSFKDFKRNGRWGTCSNCTNSDPSECEFTDRYDHNLDRDSLIKVLGYNVFIALNWHNRRQG